MMAADFCCCCSSSFVAICGHAVSWITYVAVDEGGHICVILFIYECNARLVVAVPVVCIL